MSLLQDGTDPKPSSSRPLAGLRITEVSLLAGAAVTTPLADLKSAASLRIGTAAEHIVLVTPDIL